MASHRKTQGQLREMLTFEAGDLLKGKRSPGHIWGGVPAEVYASHAFPENESDTVLATQKPSEPTRGKQLPLFCYFQSPEEWKS